MQRTLLSNLMKASSPTPLRPRLGGHILVDQLLAQGVKHVFCVPGESYLAVLDGLHDASIQVTVCRQEGGAAMMADAHGKLTGQPGICMVTRGPGASNALAGVHIAKQDSTPLILFVGQIERGVREREAFQEMDYRAVFGTQAKWVTEIDQVDRIPEIISRAFRSEEHTSELQSLMRISYAVFCLKQKKITKPTISTTTNIL